MADTVLMIRSGLFRLILSFLHIVYSGLQYFDIAWALFKRKMGRMLDSHSVDSQLYVSRFVTDLEKCPTHFAVITGTERINFEDFSNLVIWCIAAGISFISFYDHTGYLKENQELYYKYLFNKRKLDPNFVIFNKRQNGMRNGYSKNGFAKRIHVNILSIEEGKPLFSTLVSSVSERVLSDKIKLDEIDEQFVNEEVHKMVNFTDPELALVCGNMYGTFGFLPWHIRLTEFLQIPSIENIGVNEFTSILKKYSMCCQRFGR